MYHPIGFNACVAQIKNDAVVTLDARGFHHAGPFVKSNGAPRTHNNFGIIDIVVFSIVGGGWSRGLFAATAAAAARCCGGGNLLVPVVVVVVV